MRTFGRAGAGAALIMSLALAVPAAADVAGDSEGCTPGYWKQSQHFDSWQETTTGAHFATVFGLDSGVLSGVTMLQALQGGGGSGVEGARKILARAAAAAWLNAAYDDGTGTSLLFPWRRAVASEFGRPALVSTVRAALNGTDRSAMLSLASWLDADNNLGCPLN